MFVFLLYFLEAVEWNNTQLLSTNAVCLKLVTKQHEFNGLLHVHQRIREPNPSAV